MNMPIIRLAEVLALIDHTKCADVTKEHWLETIFEHSQPSL